jgi:nucleotide-binding universal stress UspA family protein
MMAAPQVIRSCELKIKKIAVLTDLSPNAGNALRFAARLARAYDAEIALAHAYIAPSCVYSASKVELVYQAIDAWREHLGNLLLRETAAFYLRNIQCKIVLRQGAPEDLLGVLKDADLIVVGTAGETGIRKAALGSTAETIFRSSSVPVLTVGPHCGCSGAESLGLDSVLYATDFSPGSAVALAYAVSVARKHDAKLLLLHVTNDKDGSSSKEPLEKLHRLVPCGIDLKYQPRYLVGFGTPGIVILEEALNCKANLIVIGARGRDSFASAVSHFGGGTAYQVASDAVCPVLTVRHS